MHLLHVFRSFHLFLFYNLILIGWFPGDYKAAVDGNLEIFKYNILKSLVSTLSVSALRIANLNVSAGY
jgi:hypothetical protein